MDSTSDPSFPPPCSSGDDTAPALAQALETLVTGHLESHRGTGGEDGEQVLLSLLITPADLDAQTRAAVRPHISAVLAGSAVLAPSSVDPLDEETTGWVLPYRPEAIPPALLTQPPARRHVGSDRPAVIADAIGVHDALVGAELGPAVFALMSVGPRTMWSGPLADPEPVTTAAVIGRDGRELYAALGADGEMCIEHHDGAPAPPSATNLLDLLYPGLAGDEPPLAPCFQDLVTAVLRRALGRPGASRDDDVDIAVNVAAVAWLHQLASHAQTSGPLTQRTAEDFKSAALRAAENLPNPIEAQAAGITVNSQEIWDALWKMLADGHALAPGMAAVDADWRDTGVLALRVYAWAGDTEAAFNALSEGRSWFTTADQASIVRRVLTDLYLLD
ncbi:hypothetical protein SMC26_40695 [Actinomadura fulvescens]|uniref:Uncharacterized protein n=1 Tax=Actinomadura fulvescens TaxID=46160 RepID=A0ABN3QZ17_9ACTN